MSPESRYNLEALSESSLWATSTLVFHNSVKKKEIKKGTWLEFNASEHYVRYLYAVYMALKDFSNNKARLRRYLFLDIRTILIYYY